MPGEMQELKDQAMRVGVDISWILHDDDATRSALQARINARREELRRNQEDRPLRDPLEGLRAAINAAPYNGKVLYEVWADEMNRQGVEVDAWPELDQADQQAWSATERRTRS